MSSAITQMAMAVIANEQTEKRAKEQAELQAVIARREAEERSVMRQRVALEAERLMAAKEAERLVAEERAARAREAEEVALRAEIERLRNRSETEILRDEVASLRAEMAGMRRQTETLPTKEVVQESIYSHLRADDKLDMRFRSSKQELSVVQQEVKELKSVVESLLKGGFRIVNKDVLAPNPHSRARDVPCYLVGTTGEDGNKYHQAGVGLMSLARADGIATDPRYVPGSEAVCRPSASSKWHLELI